MSLTRGGKILFSPSDHVCAAQILSVDHIHNTLIGDYFIWDGSTSDFMIFDVTMSIPMEKLTNESQVRNNLEILEVRRFIKSDLVRNSTQYSLRYWELRFMKVSSFCL
ncbi:hypothetical protein NPIL_326421 [Nephila pilipes]|uniref:Uncharacterized protein n=1 Tax=Nephila pilipes TaxID=299642 RepID=A0A8X6PSV2_NEPPI|nr:hypothetical protein NPIL_326421 [Nephila pilipes]